jgi:hypothetical protein
MGLIVRELKVFIILLILLSILMHFGAWFSHPIEHLNALDKSSLGLWHPIILTSIFYLIVASIRWIISLFR